HPFINGWIVTSTDFEKEYLLTETAGKYEGRYGKLDFQASQMCSGHFCKRENIRKIHGDVAHEITSASSNHLHQPLVFMREFALTSLFNPGNLLIVTSTNLRARSNTSLYEAANEILWC